MLLSRTPTDRDLCEKYPCLGSYNAEWIKSRTCPIKLTNKNPSSQNCRNKWIPNKNDKSNYRGLTRTGSSPTIWVEKKAWKGFTADIFDTNPTIKQVVCTKLKMCFHQRERVCTFRPVEEPRNFASNNARPHLYLLILMERERNKVVRGFWDKPS